MLFGLHRFATAAEATAWYLTATAAERAARERDSKGDVEQAMRWLQNASAHGIGPAGPQPGVRLPRRRRRLAPGRTTGQREGAARQGTRPGLRLLRRRTRRRTIPANTDWNSRMTAM